MTDIEQTMSNASFVIVETGGGCTAFRQDARYGRYVLVTNIDGDAIPETMNDPVMVVLYDGNGEKVAVSNYASLKVFLEGMS